MKLKSLLIISILVIASTYSFAQSDTKKIEKLLKQREELALKLQQKESALESARPLEVKRISKQIDKLAKQVENLDSQISLLEEETNVTHVEETKVEQPDIPELPEILQPTDYSEEAIITGEHEQNGVVDTERTDRTLSKEEKNNDVKEQKKEISGDTTTSSSKEEDDDPVGTILFAIGVVILFYIIGLITRERCPHCGKKGKLKSLGDTRKYQYDEKGNVTRKGVLKRYKCSHCGQYVEKIKWS